MNNPGVTIVIPAWNGWPDTAQCLDSLQKITYPNYEVVVVDNRSTDQTPELIKNNFPKVILIENQKNLGFAAACNQGIKLALEDDADYVLLLNNDTVVAPDFLDKMVGAAAPPAVGIVGAKIYYFRNKSLPYRKQGSERSEGSYFDQPKKIWFAGADFIWWRASGKHRFWQKTDKRELVGIRPCDFITGCAMLIKKELFDDIGYFYGPYFLNVEDLDFCWRAKKAGWKIVVNLDAKIWHKVGASHFGEFSFLNNYYGVRNRLYFAFKRSGNLLNLLGGCIFLFFIIPIKLIQLILTKRPAAAKGMLLGCINFLCGKMGKRKRIV